MTITAPQPCLPVHRYRLRGRAHLVLLFLAAALLALAGCASEERYRYERIQHERATAARAPSAPPPPAPLSPEVPLTLEAAIQAALARNPDNAAAVARIRQAEAVLAESQAAFWPMLALYGEYLQGDAPSAYLFKTIDQRLLPPGTDFNDPGWFENYEVGAQARWNLFNGGRDYLRRRMAETGLTIQRLDRETVQNALIASTIQAYYNALAAAAYIRIAETSVATVAKDLAVMRVRYAGGSALRSDVLSLEVRRAQAEEERIRAANSHSLALASLASLLGEDPDTVYELAASDRLAPELPPTYPEGLVYALAHRAELAQARLAVVRSRMAVDAAAAEYLPRLDAQFRYYLDDPGADFDTDRENWTAGLILNWEVFSGLSTPARVEQAQRILDEMLAQDRKATLAVQLDLKTAYLKRAEAEARLAVSDASVARAEESFRLVAQQYEGGSADITRYLEAEAARNAARIRATAAHYDCETATAALARALGFWGTTMATQD